MHTPEPWPPYSEVAQQMHPIFEHTCAWLDFSDYQRAKVCVDACAGIDTKTLELVDGAARKAVQSLKDELSIFHAMRAQRDELLAALKYHQEQTRPIQSTIDLIAKCENNPQLT